MNFQIPGRVKLSLLIFSTFAEKLVECPACLTEYQKNDHLTTQAGYPQIHD